MNLDKHDTYHEELLNIINQYSDDKWSDNYSLNQCNLGDMISVSYLTFSQRYITYYKNQFGKIIKINKKIIKNKGIIKPNNELKIKVISVFILNHQNKRIVIQNEDDTLDESFGGYTNDHSVYIKKLNK